MIILKVMINFLSSVLQVMIVDKSLRIFGTYRYGSKSVKHIGILIFALLNTLMCTLINLQPVFTLMGIVLIIIYSFIYKLNFWKRFFLITIISVIIIVFEMITGLVMSAIYKLNISEVQNNINLYIQGVLFSKLIVLGFAYTYSHWKCNKEIKLHWKTLVMLMALPITSFFIFAELSRLIFNAYEMRSTVSVVIIAIMLLLSNLMVFVIFDYIEKQKSKEMQLSMQALQLNMEKQYYYDLTQKYIMSNKTLHDLKNKLFAIDALLMDENALAKQEIKTMCDIVVNAQNMKFTGNDAVDSLLNAKINLAKSKNIEIKIIAWVASFTKYKIIDLCVILGNILDNAITATDKVNVEKTIKLEIKQIGEVVSITVSNPTLQKMKIPKKDMDKYLHGYGLKSVNEIVEKYNGDLRYGIKDDIFIINILI